MCNSGKRAFALLLSCAIALMLAGCGILSGSASPKQSIQTVAEYRSDGCNTESDGRVVSWSPDGNIKLLLKKDNNLYVLDGKGERIVYRNYEKSTGLLNHPYSLWSFDFFRIQWSSDGRYAYIIDSIYDMANDKLIPLKDSLIFSWLGNKGVYLSGGEIVEGKFWDNGFYGFYASKCLKCFEGGNIRTMKERTDDKYFIVAESSWNETEKTLFRGIGADIEIRTAKFKFGRDATHDKLIKAYQELREDEKAWKLLNGKYPEAASREKAVDEFRELTKKYPVKLGPENFNGDRLNWDFDMEYYLTDMGTEKLG